MTRTTPEPSPTPPNFRVKPAGVRLTLDVRLNMHQAGRLIRDMHYYPTATRKSPDIRHAGVGRYGNGILHCILGGEGKGFILFGSDRTGGSLISLCTLVESEFLA
ncbi:hypothetical protein AVEN_213968-1 [Araneus ventricosus]|uniref:Uncharacterized protein n=1 Tax=Araneus ventricosus TaxID=182803 RepID=A0A4Y2MUH5_ARAVE|nr:hypothetical protein AVEN_213968-1 [Araneus ventricosus]